MPVTSQPTDQPYGQLITDEKSLEQLFRAKYATLLAEAKGRLGDHAGAAPRVVSKAFHLAWQDRKRFRSMEELDAFLGANIQHGAVREQSRSAGLHRMDAIAGQQKAQHDVAEMTVDEAWDRLQHTLQGGAPEAYKERASHARHEAADHLKQLGKERNWKPVIAIGVVGFAVIVTGVWFIQKAGEDRAVDNALRAGDVRAYETSYGQQVNITLDDATVVRLGPESKLTVPKRFGLGLRSVKIDGTANFEVTRVMEKPFEVRSDGVIITATGTVFTVRRYPNDSSLILFVKQGTVEVRIGEESRTVGEGTGFAVSARGGEMSVPSTEALDETRTWADGNVTIVGHDLRYVLPQLKRWYGLNIKVPDSLLLDRKVFVRAALNSPKEAIASVEQSGGLKFGYVGENMVFNDTVPSRTRGTKRR